jgi:hypothetical protein
MTAVSLKIVPSDGDSAWLEATCGVSEAAPRIECSVSDGVLNAVCSAQGSTMNTVRLTPIEALLYVPRRIYEGLSVQADAAVFDQSALAANRITVDASASVIVATISEGAKIDITASASAINLEFHKPATGEVSIVSLAGTLDLPDDWDTKASDLGLMQEFSRNFGGDGMGSVNVTASAVTVRFK